MTESSKINLKNDENPLSQLTLGKKTDYSATYQPSLLQGVPRSLNRQEIGLTHQDGTQLETLPFFGQDLWTLYEISWLNLNNLPQVAIGYVNIPATSSFLIESKSFKLYLNSLNQTQFESQEEVQQTLIKDLSACANAKVEVYLYSLLAFNQQNIISMQGECIDNQAISIKDFKLNPELLNKSTDDTNIVEETLHSHLLKSNCLITNQPDWGSLEIKYHGGKIDRAALLRYIVSFREHNEFHEQCVERIFCDLMHYCKPKSLTVYARYTRRGGLDINPYRSTENIKMPHFVRTARQ